MLDLRPNCEHCRRPLPPEATDAVICSFECTYCTQCVNEFIGNVCPNCGGNLVSRPIRPKNNLKNGNSLGCFPYNPKVVYNPKDVEAHRDFRKTIEKIPPHDR